MGSPTDTQVELYQRFRALHERPQGFVMPNAWDGVSALLFQQAGFEALGTSSAALAAALGRIDGRHAVSREEHLANARLMGQLTKLPVNGDFEDGYGERPEDVAATVEAAIAAGLAGIGIEDTSGHPSQPIRDFDEAVARVRAAAKVARGRILLTGRTDNFLNGRMDLDDTVRRLSAFAEVGADVLFAPFPADPAQLVTLVKAVAPKPLSVNVGTRQGPLAFADLQKLGVKRLSLGGALYTRVMGALRESARTLAGGDTAGAIAGGMPYAEIKQLIASASTADRT